MEERDDKHMQQDQGLFLTTILKNIHHGGLN